MYTRLACFGSLLAFLNVSLYLLCYVLHRAVHVDAEVVQGRLPTGHLMLSPRLVTKHSQRSVVQLVAGKTRNIKIKTVCQTHTPAVG